MSEPQEIVDWARGCEVSGWDLEILRLCTWDHWSDHYDRVQLDAARGRVRACIHQACALIDWLEESYHP